MKKVIIALTLTVGFTSNAQVMLGTIDGKTVKIADTEAGCVISYVERGQVTHQDTTETIPDNYKHMTGAFYIGIPPKIDTRSWHQMALDGPSRNSGGEVVYRHYSPYGVVTTTRYGNTFHTTVIRY